MNLTTLICRSFYKKSYHLTIVLYFMCPNLIVIPSLALFFMVKIYEQLLLLLLLLFNLILLLLLLLHKLLVNHMHSSLVLFLCTQYLT